MRSAWQDCPDIYGANTEKRCVGCGAPLKGRQRVWCSGDCETLFWQNHQWGMARAVVLVRDHKRCRRCGTTGTRVWQYQTWLGTDKSFSYKETLEVNHIIPVMGRHGQSGCHHHLDGLETLCHDCHVDETNRQFKRGRYADEH
jgi:5-methylcytosine-specific restriction endonuclease McrA